MENLELHQGPYFDSCLIGPKGQLMRLHKGGGGSPKPPPPVPPPVRETAKEVQDTGNAERKKSRKRKGYNSSLLGGQAKTSETPKKSLLG